ncbi:hypothetical protein R1sor_016627 [Riccia sorocarpa]|uniref:Uncharacterized protein n=1 Tax=Riccia sorocarpa TaxID=122646 RepID=A0ABD3HFI9_9MARC
MGRNTSDTDMYSESSSSSYSDPDDRRRHRTTSKGKKKRRRQKRSFYGNSSSSNSDPDFDIRSRSSSDSDCDIRSRSCRSKLAKLEGQIDTFVFKRVTWNLWKAMRAHGRRVFGLLQFMEEVGLFLRRAVVPRVKLTLAEKFLDGVARNRLLRLGYHGSCARNREGGEDKSKRRKLSRRKHGSVVDTAVGMVASRDAMINHIKLEHDLSLRMWKDSSQKEGEILPGVLVTWGGLSTMCEVCTLDRGGGDPATNSYRKTFNSRRKNKRSSSLQWKARYFG